jgi:hypothetical protein
MRFFAHIVFLIPLVLPLPSYANDFGPTKRLAVGDILRGRFTQEHYMAGVSKPLHSEGHFVVAPGYGLIWAVEKPLPLTIVVTADGMSQSVAGVPVLHKSTTQMPFLARVTSLLSAALGGNWKTLESDFTLTREGNAKQWRVKLVPHDPKTKGMPFRELTAKGTRFVDRAELTRPDNAPDIFTFKDQTITPSPPTEIETAFFSTVQTP